MFVLLNEILSNMYGWRLCRCEWWQTSDKKDIPGDDRSMQFGKKVLPSKIRGGLKIVDKWIHAIVSILKLPNRKEKRVNVLGILYHVWKLCKHAYNDENETWKKIENEN
jgi:hypothetical protein